MTLPLWGNGLAAWVLKWAPPLDSLVYGAIECTPLNLVPSESSPQRQIYKKEVCRNQRQGIILPLLRKWGLCRHRREEGKVREQWIWKEPNWIYPFPSPRDANYKITSRTNILPRNTSRAPGVVKAWCQFLSSVNSLSCEEPRILDHISFIKLPPALSNNYVWTEKPSSFSCQRTKHVPLS